MEISPATFPVPPADDRKLYELRVTRYAFPTLAVAQEMNLFEHLAQGPKTIEDITEELQLTSRAAEAMAIVVTALGFLARHSAQSWILKEFAELLKEIS